MTRSSPDVIQGSSFSLFTASHTHTAIHIHPHVIHFHLQNLYPAPWLLASCFKSISWFTGSCNRVLLLFFFLPMIGGLQVYYWGLTYLSLGQWAYYWIYCKSSPWLTEDHDCVLLSPTYRNCCTLLRCVVETVMLTGLTFETLRTSFFS